MSLFKPADNFLVTGASSGIGQAIALMLCSQGATVIANGRDAEKLTALKSHAADSNRIIIAQRDLLYDMEELSVWLKNLAKEYGALKGLCCAAGITYNSPMSFYNLKKARQIFDICCHAPLKLAGAFGSKHIYVPPASIVFIAAAAAINPNPGQGIYAAAKGGLIAGAKCLAKELATKNIRVNCISPGLVKGPMLDETIKILGTQFLEREERAYPLGIGSPEYVANLAVFLLSSKSIWLTGQNILQSGGR